MRVFHLKKKSYWIVSYIDFKLSRCHIYQVTELNTHKATVAVKYLSEERPIKNIPLRDSDIPYVKKRTMIIKSIKSKKPKAPSEDIGSQAKVFDFYKVIDLLVVISKSITISNRELHTAYADQVGIRSIQRTTKSLAKAGYLIKKGKRYQITDQHKSWLEIYQLAGN